MPSVSATLDACVTHFHGIPFAGRAGGFHPRYLFVTDQVGSVRLVVNAETGAIVQRMDYDASLLVQRPIV